MAKISTYANDPNVEREDRWIGSDRSNNNATMNFSAGNLGNYFVSSGDADSTKLGISYRYQAPTTQNVRGIFNLTTSSTANIPLNDTLTSIRVSKNDLNGTDQTTILEFVNGGTVRIGAGTFRRVRNYALYSVTNVDSSDNNYVTLSLAFVSGNANATLIFQDTVLITPIGSGSGSGGGGGNAFGSVAVAGQTTLVADRITDTLNIVAGGGIVLTTSAVNSVDTLTISSVEHPHTNTFNGTIANRTLAATGEEQTINDITIAHSTGFTYTINSVKVPSGWTATVDTSADPDNFNLTIPSTATAGTYLVEVNYTSTETSSSTMHTDVIDFNVILTTPPTPYYVQSSGSNITGDQTLTSAPWTAVESNVRTGTTLVFTRPTSHTGTYYGGVGILTTGDGSVNIETEASFDEGTSIPDVISTGITPSGYTVYVFPLHLPRTTITITTF